MKSILNTEFKSKVHFKNVFSNKMLFPLKNSAQNMANSTQSAEEYYNNVNEEDLPQEQLSNDCNK